MNSAEGDLDAGHQDGRLGQGAPALSGIGPVGVKQPLLEMGEVLHEGNEQQERRKRDYGYDQRGSPARQAATRVTVREDPFMDLLIGPRNGGLERQQGVRGAKSLPLEQPMSEGTEGSSAAEVVTGSEGSGAAVA